MPDVTIPAVESGQTASPVLVEVARSLLPVLDADCADLAVAGRAFWVDGCGDPVRVWVDAEGRDDSFTVDVRTDASNPPDPKGVFPLFEEFDGAALAWVTNPDPGPDLTTGALASEPVAAIYLHTPTFPSPSFLVADLASADGTVGLGCGPVTNLTDGPTWWFGWSGSTLTYKDSSNDRTLAGPARADANRMEVLRAPTVAVWIDGAEVAAGMQDLCATSPYPAVLVSGGAVVERVFLRPFDPRTGRLEDPGTEPDSPPDPTDTTESATPGTGLTSADPGCGCDSADSGAVAWLVTVLALRRRRPSPD